MSNSFKVVTWNDGKHHPSGAGYGLKLNQAARDRFFDPTWEYVWLYLPGRVDPLQITLTPSFWHKCHELRDRRIGEWLQENQFHQWPKGRPFAFTLEQTRENLFHLHLP